MPLPDVGTIASHWMLFHEGDDWQEYGEAELLVRHAAEHKRALEGVALKVNHWHTETRPPVTA